MRDASVSAGEGSGATGRGEVSRQGDGARMRRSRGELPANRVRRIKRNGEGSNGARTERWR